MSQTAQHATSLWAPNQARPATGWNAFSGDRLLVSIADRLAPWAKEKAARLGACAGDEATQELARLANKHTPELKTHDRFGNRIDWVELHPAWHELMALAFGHEVHSLAWTARESGGHVARGLLSLPLEPDRERCRLPTRHDLRRIRRPLAAGVRRLAREDPLDPLRQASAALSRQERRDHRLRHDREAGRLGPAADADDGAVRAKHSDGRVYLLNGHKWFFSVPQSDGFFTLAQTKAGVTCFFVPGFLPDGHATECDPAPQGQVRQPLKRLERDRVSRGPGVAGGRRGGRHPGDLSHAHLTRLDFAIGSAGLMRQALTLALNHAQTRQGFGRRSPTSR